jgi:hypothetical protein
MCLARWVHIPVDGMSLATARCFRWLYNKHCLLPKFYKSSTLKTEVGVFTDEWNKTVTHALPYLYFHKHLHKLLGYADYKTGAITSEVDGFIVYDCTLTEKHLGLVYEDVTVYLYENNTFTNLGRPICLDHLVFPINPACIDPNDSAKIYVCTFSSWSKPEIDSKELLSIIPKEYHTLWLKEYDNVYWERDKTIEHNMVFNVIPTRETTKIMFQYAPAIGKSVMADLICRTVDGCQDYMEKVIEDFDGGDVLEHLEPSKEISDIDLSNITVNRLILNVLAYNQGLMFPLNTLYYKGVKINNEEKEKLLNTIKSDCELIKRNTEKWVNGKEDF